MLIISPHFPPVNGPDMHRIRTSLMYYEEFGWIPEVICVDPKCVLGYKDEWLSKTIPERVTVHKTGALPLKITRKLGIGSLSLRAFLHIRSMGNKVLSARKFDLVFFSTTMFHVMANGPYWKRKFGIPFVLDFQDPWRNDFYLDKPKSERPPKFRFAYWLNKKLEGLTVPHTQGIISVSNGYIKMLQDRYPVIRRVPATLIPFGVAAYDFELAKQEKIPPAGLIADKGKIKVVYTGAVTPFFIPLLRAFFSAFEEHIPHWQDYHFYFIGTSYALGSSEKKVARLAEELGISSIVSELPERIPYFTALATLQHADILLVPGSTDPDYNASKILNYIYSGKPIFCMFHENSETIRLVKECHAGIAVGLTQKDNFETMKAKVAEVLPAFSQLHLESPKTNLGALEKHTARAMTEKQCRLFDQAIGGT